MARGYQGHVLEVHGLLYYRLTRPYYDFFLISLVLYKLDFIVVIIPFERVGFLISFLIAACRVCQDFIVVLSEAFI